MACLSCSFPVLWTTINVSQLVVPTILCTHGTPSQRSWQAELMAWSIEVTLIWHQVKLGATECELTTRTRMALPIIRHLSFPVANLHFNLQLFWRENLKLFILCWIFRRNMVSPIPRLWTGYDKCCTSESFYYVTGKGEAHTHCVNMSSIHEFTHWVWAPPIMECYSTLVSLQ